MKRAAQCWPFLLDLLLLGVMARSVPGEPVATSRPVDPDLAGHWRAASVESGVMKDLSGKRADIKANIAVETVGERKGLRFGKDHPHVSVPADVRFDFTNDFTVAVWVRLVEKQADVVFLSKRGQDEAGETTGYALAHGIRGVGGIGFVAAPDIVIPTPCLAVQTWTHVAITFQNRDLILYVDGKAIGIREVESIPVAAKAPLLIGGGGPGKTMDGWLDDIRIYHRGLSTAEVKQLAGGEEPTSPYTALSAEEEKQVRGLIAQLGSGQFAKREAALKALREKGRKIFPLLKEYRESDDLEIVSRIKALLGELPENEK